MYHLKTNILIIHLKLNMHFPKIKILKDYVVLFQTKKPAFTLAIDIEAKNKIIAKEKAEIRFNNGNHGCIDSDCNISVQFVRWRLSITLHKQYQ